MRTRALVGRAITGRLKKRKLEIQKPQIEQTAEKAVEKLNTFLAQFATTTQQALQGNMEIQTAVADSHEYGESVVDAFAEIVRSTGDKWSLEGMLPTLKARTVQKLIANGVFLKEDEAALPAFLEQIKIGDRDVFETVSAWFEQAAEFSSESVQQEGAGAFDLDVADPLEALNQVLGETPEK